MTEIEVPSALFDGSSDPAETAARIARWVTLEELGFFGVKTMLELARGEYKGRFNAGVRKRFAGTYGNTNGCTAGDIELAAELRGIQDDTDYISAIYDFEIEKARKEHGTTKSA